MTGDPIRAAGTLDLTVHARHPDVPPSMRPSRTVRGRYAALTRVELRQSGPLGARARDLAAKEWTGHAGQTVCGRPLQLDELWVDYQPEPRDTLCPACFADDPPERPAE